MGLDLSKGLILSLNEDIDSYTALFLADYVWNGVLTKITINLIKWPKHKGVFIII